MKSLLTYLTFSVLFLTYLVPSTWEFDALNLKSASNSLMVCPNPCQTTDSLALIAIYNATSGPGWILSWDTSTPVCTPWEGVELDDEGYVVRITLNSNNLIGNVPPEIGNFSRIEELQLDNNNLSGTIPTEIGNLSELKLAFLDNNAFVDTIPASIGSLNKLHTLYLDNNDLVGKIPIEFLNMNNLFKLDIFNNRIDSIPDLSSTNLQPNKFRIYNNNVTFDDIVPNGTTVFGDNYHPQDSVNQPYTVNLNTGDDYTLDLGFDNSITTNSYQWYRNGLAFGAPSNSNKLVFSPVIFASAGEYRCQVTNPDFPLLTLHTRPVTINVTCGTSVYSVNDTLCPGDEIEINSVIYNESNPTGFQTPSVPDQYGCDSLIIVELNFRTENETDFTPIICLEDSIEINGTFYHLNNSTGTEIFENADQYGCDSIVQVELSFYGSATAGTLSPIICPGDSIELYGVFYSESNPSGTVILNDASAFGCDSTLNIQVNFYDPAIGSYSPTVCEGGSIEFQGITFDETNTEAQVNLGPVAAYGCDSLVNVNVSFHGPAEGAYEANLCFGDSVIINGTTYDQANPSGVELFENITSNGCDSLVIINLSFSSNITSSLNPTLCPGESIVVNSTTYDQNNPSGTEMLAGGSVNGCDSTIFVSINFHSEAIGSFESTLCHNDSILINGTWYHQSNSTGVEVFSNASINGCDSTLNINLSFYPEAVGLLTPTICSGDSLVINGIVFNESNTHGSVLFENGSVNGCDSILNMALDFDDNLQTNLNPTLCLGDSIIINGTVYNQTNPIGVENMVTTSGCDSSINVVLSFYPNEPGFVFETLCSEQGIFINGTIYNENNPSGTEVIPNGTVNGCDSTVVISLTFIPVVEGLLDDTLCPGESVTINGVEYNADNPSGIQYFENEAVSGCDSLVNIDLSFHPPAIGDFNPTICVGDTVYVNNTAYHFFNQVGTETLSNASINACDSTVNIELNFFEQSPNIIDDILCQDDEIIVNGTAYNIDNPSGNETFSNASINGCDSIVVISLFFINHATSQVIDTLCSNDTIFINNNMYHQANASGTEVFSGMAANGCDSIVSIELNFYDIIENELSLQLCPGETYELNGSIYDANTPQGTEVLIGAASNGCDSIVSVDLEFYDPIEEDIFIQLCHEDTYEINGTIYDINTPQGTEIFVGATSNGCDSTVNVNLTFYEEVDSLINTTLCAGASITVGGNIYDENNPSGTEIITNASINGCDSTIIIDLEFNSVALNELSIEICDGESYSIGDSTYSSTTFTSIMLPAMAQNGCDSLIELSLQVMTAEGLGLSEASISFENCENSILLSGNIPNQSTGTWTSLENIPLADPENPELFIEDMEEGSYEFIWTLSTEMCTDYHADTLNVYIEGAPDAEDDLMTLDLGTNQIQLDVLYNDDLTNLDAYIFELLSEPTLLDFDMTEDGLFDFQRISPLGGITTFEYIICDEDCPLLCDTASVRIELDQQNIDDIDIPNTITPNGDGVNETFIFPQLEFEADKYPDKELIIFNRWGDILYQAQPYLNDWNGTNQAGQALAQGTYYYVLRLDNANGVILRGDITILK